MIESWCLNHADPTKETNTCVISVQCMFQCVGIWADKKKKTFKVDKFFTAGAFQMAWVVNKREDEGP